MENFGTYLQRVQSISMSCPSSKLCAHAVLSKTNRGRSDQFKRKKIPVRSGRGDLKHAQIRFENCGSPSCNERVSRCDHLTEQMSTLMIEVPVRNLSLYSGSSSSKLSFHDKFLKNILQTCKEDYALRSKLL